MTRIYLHLLLIALTQTASALPEVSDMQSFEDEVPAHITVEKGTLSVSERYSQDGVRSLRWDWVPGDRLTVQTGPLGDINVWTGYANYMRSTIEFMVYNETPQSETMVFRWMTGEESGGYFEYPLSMEGWQRICYHYTWRSNIKDRKREVLKDTDRVVIEAPESGDGGTIYLDRFFANVNRDWRMKSHPVTEFWTPIDIETLTAPELLGPPSEEELDSMNRLLPRRDTNGWATVQKIEAYESKIIEKYGFRELEDGHRVGRSATWKELTPDMLHAANLWKKSANDEAAEKAEAVYFMLDDHLRTLGAVAQGSMRLNNYIGRTHADACFIMREPLLRTGRLDRVRKHLKWSYNYDQIFTSERFGRSMDFHYNESRYLLNIALMHNTPKEIVQHLRFFKQAYARMVVETIKPDGSLHHHGGHYFAYAGGAMNSTVTLFERLDGTVFAPGRGAYDAVKKALLVMTYYANRTDLPVTMHGRHPGRQQLVANNFGRLARLGRPYYDGKPDPELASTYLYLTEGADDTFGFEEEGISPKTPHGNLVMNHAALMGQRRDKWLAMVRGYGKYSWAQESYADANRHGLFMGNGCLDILATGDPVNIIDSGCVIAEGWDWRHFDGSTSILLPFAKMAVGNGTYMERSEVTFIGGLSHDGRNGVFVMPLRSSRQYAFALEDWQKPEHKDGQFKADKSYFFFGDRIVGLGAGIEAPGIRYPVVTTLFQKHLKTPDLPITVDGKELTALDAYQALDPASAHTLLDIQQNGYYVPAGQHVRVARRRQLSRDGQDKKDTEGDHALAWLDHGQDVRNAEYEYIIHVKTTPRAMAEFAEAMASPAPPVRVLRKDAQAHIVHDADAKSTGYVLFDSEYVGAADENFDGPSVLGVSRPCLAMVESMGDGRVRISLGDPDLHLKDEAAGQSVLLSVHLSGMWDIVEGPAGAVAEPLDPEGGGTALSLNGVGGESYTLFLSQRP